MRDFEASFRLRRYDEFGLYAVSFINTVSYGQLFVALPFTVTAMGGSATQVGLAGGLFQGLYVLALLVNRFLGVDRLNSRFCAMVSSVALTLSSVMMAYANDLGWLFSWVSLFGVSTSWLWPPVMGWMSLGCEGAALNRRLGRFNAAWSAGLVIGPWLAGKLYEVDPRWPFYSCCAYHVASFLLLLTCVAPDESSVDPTPPRNDSAAPLASSSETGTVARRFRLLARIALVGGYAALGLLRYSLAVLAEKVLGLGAATFGLIGTFLSFTMSIAFMLLGTHPWWHHRVGVFWGAQAALGVALLIAFRAQGAAALFWSAGLAGAAISFVYASHLYYGVSGGRRRARLMAIHEMLLSVGMLAGSLGGGVVADRWGYRRPFMIGFLLLVGMILAQVALHAFRRSTLGAPPEASPAPAEEHGRDDGGARPVPADDPVRPEVSSGKEDEARSDVQPLKGAP